MTTDLYTPDAADVTPLAGEIPPSARATFMFAGDAVFTLRSKSTGARFTYRVKAKDNGEVYFVSVLTGPENGSDYSYLGIIPTDAPGRFIQTAGSKFSPFADCAVAFRWFWKHQDSPLVEFWHEGRCGRCGRPLTVPESIESGLGPVCAKLVAQGK